MISSKNSAFVRRRFKFFVYVWLINNSVSNSLSAILERFQAEINLKYTINEEVKSYLKYIYINENLSSLLHLFKSESGPEKLKSIKRWKSKEKLLEKYENEFKQSDFAKTRFPTYHQPQH